MPMNVASTTHGAITLSYKQAKLESLRIKPKFSIWIQIFAQMFE
jgi:hypothetical protein